MSTEQTLLVAACAAIGLLMTLKARPELSASYALTGSIIFLVMIPPDVSPLNSVLGRGFPLLLLLLGAFRSGLLIRLAPLSAVGLVVVMTVRSVTEAGSATSLVATVLLAGMLLTVLFVASQLPEPPLRSLSRSLPIIIPAQFLLALVEIMGGDAIWPRRDGETFRVEGTNTLLPDVAVRAMGTTGYVITLGILMAVCAVLCVGIAAERRQKRWLLLALPAVGTIVMSGTRTGLLMIVVGLLIIWLKRWRFGGTLALVLLAPMAWLTVDRSRIQELFGFGDQFLESRSYEHRAGILNHAGTLFQRSDGRVLFGDGVDGASQLVREGDLGGVVEVGTFDNDYLRILAAFGIVGFTFLLVMLVRAFLRGSIAVSAGVGAFAIALAAYDVTGWRTLFVLLLILVASAFNRPSAALAPSPGGRAEDERPDIEPRNTESGKESLHGAHR